jgi:hypothetical protein
VVHIAPICLVLLAACGGTLIWERSLPRWMAVAGLAAFVAIQLGGCFVVARRNTMSPFMAAVHVLEPHVQRGELVMASAEYGIPMQYPDNLIDDQRLGCQTGKRADWIVLGFRYTSWFDWAKEHEPDTYSCVSQLLDQSYQTVFQDVGIRVERRLVTVPAR